VNIEEDVTAKYGFDVRRSFDTLIPTSPLHHEGVREKIQNIFDTTPIKEVREECVNRLRSPSIDSSVSWFADRILAYLDIKDFDTALMLLRGLSHVPEYHKRQVFSLMLDVLRETYNNRERYGYKFVKEAVVVVCGHLTHNPEAYDSRARDLIRKILEMWAACWPHGMSDEGCRIVQRLILIVSKVCDTSLLPTIRKFIMPLINPDLKIIALDYHFKYLSVNREEILTDALARQAVAYLESLNSQEGGEK